MKTALITGITGQDGSYLAELLLSKGYTVHGIVRRSSSFNTSRLERIYADPHENGNLRLHYGDVTDFSRIGHLVNQIKPHELYNLAAQSHVRVSFDEPINSSEVDAIGALNVLEAVRLFSPGTRLYQASTSELFGSSQPPQSEKTPFQPRSPYAVAKNFALEMSRNYREARGLWVASGILFNHESPRRGSTFLTRKVTRAVSAISQREQRQLFLGNLEARRDWGYAPDYVVGMWRMMQLDEPIDCVLATGRSISVREFVQGCFEHVGLNWEEFTVIDETYLRPTEVDHLLGDPSLARSKLGWNGEVQFEELVSLMMEYDLKQEKGLDVPRSRLWDQEFGVAAF